MSYLHQINVYPTSNARFGNLFLATSTQGLAAVSASADAAKFMLKQKKKERRQRLFKR